MGLFDGRRGTEPSVLDSLTLSPVPYPVLFILAVVFLFLCTSWFFSFEEAVETMEVQFSWAFLFLPLLLLLLIRWLSSMESPDFLFGISPFDPRKRGGYYNHQVQEGEGSSPWGVAAVVVLLLVLSSFQSTFRDMWRP